MASALVEPAVRWRSAQRRSREWMGR